MTKGPPGDDDALAFEEAVRGARPIPKGAELVAGGPPPGVSTARRPVAEARAERAAIIDGDGTLTSAVFKLALAGEQIEGRGPGVDARVVRRLKAGDPRVEAHLDLHGHSRETAVAALERFVQTERAAHRVLLVIHGRGAHSGEGAVVKPLVWRWLASSRAAAAAVLAFTSARPSEGGDGATVVLLRKPPR
jgi:DNA-nicking Smr family endonuclease